MRGRRFRERERRRTRRTPLHRFVAQPVGQRVAALPRRRYRFAMARHVATVEWRRGDAPFVDNRYPRAHVWRFDGGAEVPASSSPHSVPIPLSDPAGVDPEEAFVASLSSCHMLWFLFLAAKRGLVVDRYVIGTAVRISTVFMEHGEKHAAIK